MNKYTLSKCRKGMYKRLGNGVVARRIVALVDIGDRVKKGDVGGYIADEGNLSQEGDCWIYGNSIVCQKAVVRGNAIVEDSYIEGNSIV